MPGKVSKISVAVLVLASGSLLCAQDNAVVRKHDKLDPIKLAESLSQMQMTELLEHYVEQFSEDGESIQHTAILIESRISQANSSVDLQRRNKLLNRVKEDLEKIISLTEDATTAEEVIAHLRFRFKLAEVIGSVRAQPYATRLMYLQCGAKEITELGNMTEAATQQLWQLIRDIDETLRDWRGDLVKLVTVVADLEQLKKEVEYRYAWIRFYRGITLGDETQRKINFSECIKGVSEYATNDNQGNVKFRALLLTGMAQRELKQFSASINSLDAAADKKASKQIQLQAGFEIARCLIEQGEFKKAADAIKGFNRLSRQLLGPEGQLETDVKSIMLLNYYYEANASQKADTEESAKYRYFAQKALIDFLEKYKAPAIQNAFYLILARKSSGRSDFEKLGSVVLLARAVNEIQNGKPENARPLLQRVLERNDKASVEIRPLAIWHLALVMNDLKRNVEAGRGFVLLVQDYPDNHLATKAALNAVISYHGYIVYQGKRSQAVPADLRMEFVEALKILLSRAEQITEANEWLFELGWQYQQIAKSMSPGEKKGIVVDDAIKAFEDVPPSHPEYIEAQYQALSLRVVRLKEAEPSKSDAEFAIFLLKKFSEKVSDEVLKTDLSHSSNLKNWGAQADFYWAEILYDILGRRGEAIALLEAMPAKWPDAELLKDALEFQIDRLLKDEQTAKAIVKVEGFREKYPAQAGELVYLITQQIQSRIEKSRLAEKSPVDLQNYRKAYLAFAKDLYDRARSSNADAEELNTFKRMYASALAESDDLEPALELLSECLEFDALKRQEEIGRIDSFINGKLQQLESAGKDKKQLATLSDEYFRQLKLHDIQPDENAVAIELKMAWRYLGQQKGGDEEALSLVSEKLTKAINSLGAISKGRLNLDAVTIHGLARVHCKLKQYDIAARYYNELVGGLDPNAHQEMYWLAELELCRCLMEGFSEDKKVMKRLVYHIRQLRLEDKQMHGLGAKFGKLEEQAFNLSK